MKILLFKPCTKLLFATGIIVMLVLPQALFAQTDKQPIKVLITIKDNDTTFNGKNLNTLPPKEKQEALAEINKINKGLPFGSGRRKYSLNFKNDKDGRDSAMHLEVDSARAIAGTGSQMRKFRPQPENSGYLPPLRNRIEDGVEQKYTVPINPSRLFKKWDIMRKGSQQFSFTNIDKNNITTHVSYMVANIEGEEAKRVAGTENVSLDLQDLTLTPQFSAGKTVLSFLLPAKTATDVQLTDIDGKILWKDKATSANFIKSFTIGLNGIYYLVVKQAGKTAVKRIVKE